MTMTNEEFEQVCQFMIELGTLGHRCRLASSYLESSLSQFTESLGFSGYVLATPKWLNFIFWRPGDRQQHRYFVPLPAVSYDLAKLASIGHLLHQLRQGKLTIAEGLDRLKQIDQQAPPYGSAMVGLGYVLAGVGFAVLLSAAWRDVALSGLLSLVVYGLVLQAGRWPWLASRLEVSSALVAGVLAYGGTKLGGQWGPWQGSFLGSLFLGCYTYLFAWVRQVPTAVVWLPGIMILVPGAAVYLGLETLETSGVASGLAALAGVMVQIGAIVGGIVVSASIVPQTIRSGG